MSGWIRLKDQWPPEGVPVLTWNSAWRSKATGEMLFGSASVRMYYKGYEEVWKLSVSHWMPLQPPPERGADGGD